MMSKSQVKISHFQLMAMLSVSAIFTITSTLPGMANHSMNRFMTLPITAVIMLALYTPLMLSPRGLSGVKNSFFRWMFAVILVLRLLYFAILTMLQFEYRVTCTAMPYVSPIYFMAIIFGVTLYGLRKGLQATARVAPVSLALYVILILLISFSVWDKVDVIRIYSPFSVPFFGEENSIMSHALKEVIRHDELFIFAAIMGFVREKDGKSQAKKSVLIFIPFVLIIGLWLNFLYNAVLGRLINYTACQMYTISSFSSFNIVERMDGFFISTAVIGGIFKMIMCFVCIRAVLAEAFFDKTSEQKEKIITSALLFLIAVPTFFLFGAYDWLNSNVMNFCYIAATAIIALLLPAAIFISNISDRKKSS
jgi:hypothetical protein